MSRLWLVLGGAALALVGFHLWEDHQAAGRREEIARRDEQIRALEHRADSLARVLPAQVETAYAYRDRWHAGRVDTLPGRVDTLPAVVKLLAIGDSAIGSCHLALATCGELAKAERARADSLVRQVSDWRALAKGPFLSGNLGAYKRVDSTGFLLSGGARLGRTWAVVARGDVALPNLHLKEARGRVYVGLDRKF